MKRFIMLLVALSLLSACNEPPVLDVKGIKTNLPAYQKKVVTVEGVVSAWTSKDPQLFAIADVTDAQNNKQFLIPIRFEGAKPGVGETVRVTGRLDMKKREFIAAKIKQQ